MGSVTINWNSADDNTVYDALSCDGNLNEGSETNAQCAERIIKQWVANKIKTHLQEKDAKTAKDAVNGVNIT